MMSIVDKQFDILVVGELNPDLVLTGDVVPAFGQVEQLLDTATLAIGSSSGIFACAAARLGLKVAFVGMIGNDTFGEYMNSAIRSRGVDTQGLIINKGVQTGISVILAKGVDRAILTFPGSIPLLTYRDIDLNLLSKARHLHLASYFLLDRLRPDIPTLLQQAHLRGLTVSLDTNYDPLEKWDGGIETVLKELDVFLPNQAELLAISKSKEVDCALEIISKSVPLVAVKQGALGGLARSGDTIVQSASIPVQVRDTVGAGDSFDAGFLFGYLNHWTIQRSLQLACVCGSLSTRDFGGTTAQATLEEALPFLDQ